MGIIVLRSFQTGLGTGESDQISVGTGTSAPGGVESIIEYNGLYLNDRSKLDTYLITNIDGMHDADVRDSRALNPGSDGETYFRSYYGGRTIVLTGRIRAMTMAKLRDMQQALRAAFSDINRERNLVFHSGNLAKTVYINCKKSQPIVMAEVQQNFQCTRDFQITLRASDPYFYGYSQTSFSALIAQPNSGYDFTTNPFSNNTLLLDAGSQPTISGGSMHPANTSLTKVIENVMTIPTYASQTSVISFRTGASVTSPAGAYIGIILKRQSPTSLLMVRVLLNGGSSSFQACEMNSGTVTVLSSVAVSLSANTTYNMSAWMYDSVVGTFASNYNNKVYGNLYTTSNTLLGSVNNVSINSTGIYGEKKTGKTGLIFQVGTDYTIDSWVIRSGPLGAAFSVPNGGNTNTRPIMRLYGDFTTLNGGTVEGLMINPPGESGIRLAAPSTYYSGSSSITTNSIIQGLTIAGNSNPMFSYTGEKMLEIDFARKTIVRKTAAGVFLGNAFDQLTASSQWFEFSPGIQAIEVNTAGTISNTVGVNPSANTRIELIVSDTYI